MERSRGGDDPRRGKRLSITSWMSGRVAAVQATAQSVSRPAQELGTSITGALQNGASAVVSGVTGAVGGIVDRIGSVARSIPIPNLPGSARSGG